MSWEGPRPRRDRRTLVGALVVAALVLVGAVALGGARDRGVALPITTTEDAPDTAASRPTGTMAPPTEIAPVETARSVRGGGPLLADTTGFTIVVADFASRLQMVDVSSGAVETIVLFTEGSASRAATLQAIGDDLVLDTTSGVVVRLREGQQRPVVLARNHRSVTTTAVASVWVHDGTAFGAGGIATRIDLDGTELDRIELPALARPLAGTADGLIVATPDTISLIDGDGTRQSVTRGQALASDGRRVATLQCDGDLSCNVVAGPIDDPDRVSIPLGPGEVPTGLFNVSRGRFSPDGRWLALPVHTPRRGGGLAKSRVVVYDLVLGIEAFNSRGSSLTQPDTPLAWSPNSRWLIVSTGIGLVAWELESLDVTELNVRLSPTYAIAAR
ncbi:hypothetical protein BH23ACT10_BH23ACT10_28710 [soil metagenome]